MFYFCCILIVFYNLLLYSVFRSGIYDYLRLSKMSKNNIKKNRKGFTNYWFYRTINKLKPIGILYIMNYIFLISTVVFTVLAIAIGFIRMFRPIILVCAVLLWLIEIPSTILASIYSNKVEYGKVFVFFAKRKYMRGYCSSLVDMFSWIVTAFFIYLSYQQLQLCTYPCILFNHMI